MTHIPTHPPDQTEEQREASFASANIPLPPITSPEAITSNDLQTTVAPVITPVEVPEVPIAPPPEKEAPIDTTPTSTDVLFGEVESAIEGVTGFDREAGITQRTQSQQRRLIEINKQISLRQARNIKEVEAAKVSGRTTQFGAIASQKVRRTQAIESLELSAERAAITGELILARQLAGDAVDAKFAEQESNLNTQRANLISNFDSFTKAQQKQAEALLLRIDGDLKAIESQKENQKSIEGEVNLAASFGATSEQMEDIRNSATQAEAIGKRTEAGLIEAEALKTQVVEVGGRKLLVNTQTGETIQDLGEVEEKKQFVSATKTQPGGVFDPATGIFVPSGVGPGSVADGQLTNAQKRSLEQADTAITQIDVAIPLIKSTTPRGRVLLQEGGGLFGIGGLIGAGGQVQTLEASLDTVRALIGFDALEKMRLASPTGGALGQISERELQFLQSVAGSIASNQSNTQLLINLDAIRTSFGNVQFIIEATAEGFSEQEIQDELARRKNK